MSVRAWDIEYGNSELAKSSQCESFIIQNLVCRKSYFLWRWWSLGHSDVLEIQHEW